MNCLSPDPADRTGLIGIDQRIGRIHGNRLVHRGQRQLDLVFDRDRRMNIDRLQAIRKTRLLYLKLVDPIGQTLHIQAALIVGGQRVPVLVRLADNLYCRFNTQASRVGHSEAQFTAVALT